MLRSVACCRDDRFTGMATYSTSAHCAAVSLPSGLGHAILVTLLAALPACVAIPQIAAPRISVDTVQVDRVSAAEAAFTVILNIANPNDREVGIEAIDADVKIEQIVVGTLGLAEPVRLAARAETTVTLTARTDLANSLRAMLLVLRRTDKSGQAESAVRSPIRYAVTGSMTIDGGTIPFSRSGEINWPRPQP